MSESGQDRRRILQKGGVGTYPQDTTHEVEEFGMFWMLLTILEFRSRVRDERLVHNGQQLPPKLIVRLKKARVGRRILNY
jgi:hypothetical protein